MNSNIIRSLNSAQFSTVLDVITQAPGRFLGQVRMFVLENPNIPLFGQVRIESYVDEKATKVDANAAFISKIVLAKTTTGTYTLIVSTKPIHRTNIVALAGSFNPEVVRFGRHDNAKGEFFVPEGVTQYAYLVAPDGKVLFLAADRPIEYGKKSRLNALKWEFARDTSGRIYIQAQSQDGKAYNLMNIEEALVEENADLLSIDLVQLPKQVQGQVTDMITILTDKQEHTAIYGTRKGLFLGTKMVKGTDDFDVIDLCINAQTMKVVITTRSGLYLAQIKDGTIQTPQLANDQIVNQPWFNNNVRALIGPEVEGDIVLGSWTDQGFQQHLVPFRNVA